MTSRRSCFQKTTIIGIFTQSDSFYNLWMRLQPVSYTHLAFKLTLALHGQRAILLYGPSPSGKTYVIQQTAAMWGHSVQRLWLTKKTLPSELSAMYQYAFANHQWILLENIQDASESTLKAMLPLLVLNASSDCRVMLTVSSASLADIPEVIRASVLLLYCSSIASL